MSKISKTAKLVAALALFLGSGPDVAHAQEEAAAFAKNPAYSNVLVARRGYDEASLWERVGIQRLASGTSQLLPVIASK